MSTPKLPLNVKGPIGKLSETALTIHHDKLYAGYVDKKDEIQNKLAELDAQKLSVANATYSELRGLKQGESFAINGVNLHEWYFGNLGGSDKPGQITEKMLTKTFGSYENFSALFSACGIAARGWVVLAWDTHDSALKIYTCDAHNQDGVWGAIPVLVLDVYEHAYFMDYGSDRKTYIQDFMNNINWQEVEKRINQINIHPIN